MATSHFLTLNDLSNEHLFKVLKRARVLKQAHHNGERLDTLSRHVLAMIFEKSSTRTRVSFEAGMNQLGGSAIFLSPNDSQLGRGEPLADTARVLSQMISAIMIRTDRHQKLIDFSQAASVPVINGLSDSCHPCQLLADLQAIQAQFGHLEGLKVVWIGDGNNMCQTYCEAAGLCGFHLTISHPEGYAPAAEWVELGHGQVDFEPDPVRAVEQANVITTDVWASMGQEAEQTQRINDFAHYQVTEGLLDRAAQDVCFLHCLPAHQGEEISDGLFNDPRTRTVWEQAGNRLHAQKALLEHLILN
jgi:ornithine carbamoyltransferase